MLFIKTELDYVDFPQVQLVDINGNVEEGVKIDWDDMRNRYIITTKRGSVGVKEDFYTPAKQMGQTIKVDFNGAKGFVRRMDEVDMLELQNKRIVNNLSDVTAPTPVNIDDLDILTTKLRDVSFDPRLFIPTKTGTYLDTFISHKGGFLPGTNIMITGEPGVGKSANLMEMLINVKKEDPTKKVLYISAEMSAVDVYEFKQYYPGLEDIDFLYIAEYITNPNLNILASHALQNILNKGWDVVVMDSQVEIQSMITEDLGLTQKAGERWMLDLMNLHNGGHNKSSCYTTFLVIQQKNKGGQYVGSKRLEHMMTAFLQMCWDAKEKGKRYMIFEKNRKGKEQVKLYYNFSKTDGIVYEQDRHSNELTILERLQSPETYKMPEFTAESFEKMFNLPEKI